MSPDLSRQIDRNKLEIMGQVWPMGAVAKHASTSNYGAVVALDESPLVEGLLFAGTDDGLIHVSEDGGRNWSRHESFPDIPDMTYVNEVFASLHDRNTVYAAFNNHKRGDFKPYLLKSVDLGRSWTSIASNLPERGSVYAIEQDHVNPGLLFVGTEFGVFYSLDGGAYWKQIQAGVPTIAVRDIAIQRRENDLVLGTFGRGFYILDDYTPLRELSTGIVEAEAHIFGVTDGLMFFPFSRIGGGDKGFQGETYFAVENPEVGAKITYYYKDSFKSLKAKREEEEGKKFKEKQPIDYPSYEDLRAEEEEEPSYLILTIQDAAGNPVRTLRQPMRDGVQRVNWDLRFPNATSASARNAEPLRDADSGILALPGTYQVSLSKSVAGVVSTLTEPVAFQVRYWGDRTLPASDPEAWLAFNRDLMELSRAMNGARQAVRDLQEKVPLYRAALKSVLDLAAAAGASQQVDQLEERLDQARRRLFGDDTRDRLDQDQPPSISQRLNTVLFASFGSTSDPTRTQRDVYALIESEFDPLIAVVNQLLSTDVPALEQRLEELGAPWTPGRTIRWRRD